MTNTRLLIFILCLFFTSCGGNSVKTEFILVNATPDTLEVNTTALVIGPDSREYKTIQDLIPPSDTVSMRTINTAEKFQIKEGVFSEMAIYRRRQLSNKDPLEQSRWIQTLNTKDKKEFVLTVDTTFFE